MQAARYLLQTLGKYADRVAKQTEDSIGMDNFQLEARWRGRMAIRLGAEFRCKLPEVEDGWSEWLPVEKYKCDPDCDYEFRVP